MAVISEMKIRKFGVDLERRVFFKDRNDVAYIHAHPMQRDPPFPRKVEAITFRSNKEMSFRIGFIATVFNVLEVMLLELIMLAI